MTNPSPHRAIFWLSLHLPYACRHAGACCSSGWPIPLERARVEVIATAIKRGQLDAPAEWLRVAPGQPPDIGGVLAVRDNRCIFHRPAPVHPSTRARSLRAGRTAPVHRTSAPDMHCGVHDALGHSALPTACQHFPRECLIDDRGVSVTLSHYCPTAAELLLTHHGPIEIVVGPTPVPGGTPEGLDARGGLPPLLTPRVLMDHASHAAWEAHLVSWLGGVRNPDGRWLPEQVLRMLACQARDLADWRPGARELIDAIGALADEAPNAAPPAPAWDEERDLRATARASLAPSHCWADEPADLEQAWRAHVAPAWPDHAVVVNRLLAAHAFASWMAYQGNGVIAGLRRLRLTLAVLRAEAIRVCARDGAGLTAARLVESVRQTDLMLVHLIDREELARRLGS